MAVLEASLVAVLEASLVATVPEARLATPRVALPEPGSEARQAAPRAACANSSRGPAVGDPEGDGRLPHDRTGEWQSELTPGGD